MSRPRISELTSSASASAMTMPSRRRCDDAERVPERLPEHVVVGEHLLIVLEPDENGGLQRRPGLERQQRRSSRAAGSGRAGRSAATARGSSRSELPCASTAARQSAVAWSNSPPPPPASALLHPQRCRGGAVAMVLVYALRRTLATPFSASASAVLASLRPSTAFWNSGQNASLICASLASGQLPVILSVCSSCVCITA